MIMNKLSKYNDFINESIRDRMTPKSEEDIRYSMGEKKYHIYKSLRDAKDSIKSPYETGEIFLSNGTGNPSNYFGVKVRFLSFTVSYNGELWVVDGSYNKNQINSPYRFWNEAWEGIVEFTNKSFTKEISTIEEELNRHQRNINEIKELLSEISLNNKSMNEGVRELMTPKDNYELNEAVKQIFKDASKDGISTISEDIFEYWNEMSEDYILFDNYYLYEGNIFFLYDNWQEGNDPLYQLSVVYRDPNKLKNKLEKAIEKINRQ